MRAIAARFRGSPSDLEVVIDTGAEPASTCFAVVGIATGGMAVPSLPQLAPAPAIHRSGRLIPVRPNVDPVVARTAFGARHLGPEPRDKRITWVARHIDHRLVSAGVVEAIGNEMMHALPPHVGEVHRRAGRVLELGHGCSSAMPSDGNAV